MIIIAKDIAAKETFSMSRQRPYTVAGKCNTVPDSLCHIGSERLIENEFALTVMKSGSLHNG